MGIFDVSCLIWRFKNWNRAIFKEKREADRSDVDVVERKRILRGSQQLWRDKREDITMILIISILRCQQLINWYFFQQCRKKMSKAWLIGIQRKKTIIGDGGSTWLYLLWVYAFSFFKGKIQRITWRVIRICFNWFRSRISMSLSIKSKNV
jgi:hypothetical protein